MPDQSATPAPLPDDAPTHYAVLGVEPDLVAGTHCDVTVVTAAHTGDTPDGTPRYAASDNVVWDAELTVPTSDPARLPNATEEADAALAAAGWTITGHWAEAGDRAWYVEVSTAA